MSITLSISPLTSPQSLFVQQQLDKLIPAPKPATNPPNLPLLGGLLVVCLGVLITCSSLGHGPEDRDKAGGLARKMVGPGMVAGGLVMVLLRCHKGLLY